MKKMKIDPVAQRILAGTFGLCTVMFFITIMYSFASEQKPEQGSLPPAVISELTAMRDGSIVSLAITESNKMIGLGIHDGFAYWVNFNQNTGDYSYRKTSLAGDKWVVK